MKTLELKHIAPYLPYNLYVIRNGNNNLEKLRFLITDTHEVGAIDISNYLCSVQFLSQIKPILRPISDLAKEIEIEGKKFVPIDFIENRCSSLWEFELIHNIINRNRFKELPYWLICNLLEWHFNVFDLPENLFVNYNDIKKK